MTISLRISLICMSVLFFVLIVYFIKKEKLSLRYSLLWMAAALCMIVLALAEKQVVSLAAFLGFEKASNMVLLGGVMILFCISFSLSIIVSKQAEKIRVLAQRMALSDFEKDEKK